jgi:hypothetical protein
VNRIKVLKILVVVGLAASILASVGRFEDWFVASHFHATVGARAIYAPLPTIADDLRENAIDVVAVAHFKIGYDGKVEVSLVHATENRRLNQILLDTLKHWRFTPATKDGVAVESEFDLRIPITGTENRESKDFVVGATLLILAGIIIVVGIIATIWFAWAFAAIIIPLALLIIALHFLDCF